MILADNHLHTNFSDGNDSPQSMIEAAIACGFKQITFTDHVRASSGWVEDYYHEIERLQKQYCSQILIKIGVECKVVNFKGTLDCPDNILKHKNIEKIAAIHRIPDGKGDFIKRERIPDDVDYARECYLRSIEGLMYNKYVSRLAHPFSLFSYMNIYNPRDDFWNVAFNIIKKVRVPIEYNSKYDNSVVPDFFWAEVPVVFGSDSHSTENLYERREELKRVENSLFVNKK